MSTNNLVIGIYSHPEYYPPTLNALECLAQVYNHIYVVHRNVAGFDWKYPPNVTLLHAGDLLDVREAEAASVSTKVRWFRNFKKLLHHTIRKVRPALILLYDPLALFAMRRFGLFNRYPGILWYHNHDVSDAQYLRKYSLSWWAWKYEKRLFPRLGIFSLPAMERKTYFPMGRFRGQFWFLPNFPSKQVYSTGILPGTAESNEFRLLYQGSIGPAHGLEEIIPLLARPVNGKILKLVLKGFVSDEYLNELKAIAAQYQVQDHLLYLPPGGYRGVIENARTCHAGIGIHKKDDLMNKTLGTASNKIYEYAASGMPVLVYDNEHFRKALNNRSWVMFTDTSEASLSACLYQLVTKRHEMGEAALADFRNDLCFENYFLPLVGQLTLKQQ